MNDAPPRATEVNFDALVGPTHNYAGLSPGNLASAAHAGAVSSPRAAARQGLDKMRLLMRMGLTQGVLPPHERPDLRTLRALGFDGTDEQVLRRAAQDAPSILSACCSASSMWAANAATVSPSADTADARVHLTPANLNTHFHRHLEPPTTTRVLRAIFTDPARFVVHDPLPSTPAFSDEGAANFMRLASSHDQPALEVFVYGRRGIEPAHATDSPGTVPSRFPARQTLEASQAVARRHEIDRESALFIRQNPGAIDRGVFHNDVIAVANQNVLFSHEHAFAPDEELRLIEACRRRLGDSFVHVRITSSAASIDDAVKSYLFNSQLLTIPGRPRMTLLAPTESRDHPRVRAVLDDLTRHPGSPIDRVEYADVRQSMNNGGGPACLRLRVVLTAGELGAMNRAVLLSEQLAATIESWIDRRYRDTLAPADLADPRLVTESRDALDELTRILHLGAVYDFQR